MKLVQAAKGQFSFQIDGREKQVFFRLLQLYPLIPATHPKLSRGEARREDQQLLEEALAAQRAQNQRRLLALMNARARFQENQHGYRFSLRRAEMEWLLQVLNDVRVGGWLLLGSPDGLRAHYAALNEKTFVHYWAMEVAGHFQMTLLEAISGGMSSSESAASD